ncbi:MAE_28990/MAE_18760 family HEPN-like nuclease [Telluribacter sp. SYSU D00476]|uniref:MAE_28990/MAE_18760 family HEPN-like nuclease n=1 Tax=Telluribacter sp. SYSU D00476 TaxID=2811430 RepID=UPI001FF3C8BB|nr:MAE_28990/MAE_18760 family HEPN-like nuclease [Telluribacter sp. SYSU D00476]
MNSVLTDFEKRVAEIELFFSHLESIEESGASIYFPHRKRRKIVAHDPELIKVLKANLFLLLYNLAESSIKQSLTEIYDSISANNLKYNKVIDEIKKIWIIEKYDNFKNKGTDNIFSTINNLAEEIIEIRFDHTRTISGNIDGRKIREFSIKYGFSNKVHKNANNGNKLHLVKTQRNNLAHGVVSFAECGRNYTISDLRIMKKETVLYLRNILKNIEKYLNTKKFIVQ